MQYVFNIKLLSLKMFFSVEFVRLYITIYYLKTTFDSYHCDNPEYRIIVHSKI